MSAHERFLPAELPLPRVDDFTRPFLTSGELLLQHCRECDSIQHPPGEVCFTCGGFVFDQVRARPTGVISSYTIVHHAAHQVLVNVVPYNVVIVALDGYPDVRIVGNLLGIEPGDIEIGARVIGSWTDPLTAEGQDPVRLLQWSLETG